MLVDEARIFVKSGKGGNGAVSFRREKHRPRGGPDGGDGGNGGSVVLEAASGLGSLSWLRRHPHQKAGNGINGARDNRTGARAPDLVLKVPVGTVVRDHRGRILADLASAGDRVTVARGGRGGRGNASLTSSGRRAPGFAELGEPGEEVTLQLELSLIAEVAVIGLPNAGKSTLVGALSAAHPRVADYPFTTLEPCLGVVSHAGESFTVCDIPGLVEGAHEGRGLGLKFLRHATRCGVFLHMIDVSVPADPLEAFDTVSAELRSFRAELSERPVVVALNKVDVAHAGHVAHVKDAFSTRGLEAYPVSAARGTGLESLVARLHELVTRWRAERAGPAGYQLFASSPEPITVVRESEVWRVSGGSVIRWVAMTDLSNPEAVAYLQNRLERAGVEAKLGAAGAQHGDEVRIGSAVFSWWPKGSAPPEVFSQGSR